MLSALAVANHFLKRALAQEAELTGAQLQCLVYIAHGLRLGLVSEPLLDEPVFATPEGITITSLNVAGATGERLQHRLLTQTYTLPSGLIDERIPVLAEDELARATLDHVWARFSGSSVEALRRLIVKTGGPWHSTWHSAERMMGSFSITIANTWDPTPEQERPVAIANTLIRGWFRAALIKDLKQQASTEGLEQTTRIGRVTPAELRAIDDQWDASATLTLG